MATLYGKTGEELRFQVGSHGQASFISCFKVNNLYVEDIVNFPKVIKVTNLYFLVLNFPNPLLMVLKLWKVNHLVLVKVVLIRWYCMYLLDQIIYFLFFFTLLSYNVHEYCACWKIWLTLHISVPLLRKSFQDVGYVVLTGILLPFTKSSPIVQNEHL